MTRALPTFVVLAWLLPGCDYHYERMIEQAHYRPYEATPLFADGKVMRRPPVGTVALEDRRPASQPPLTRALLGRGHILFDRLCATCHGPLGDGQSEVAENMILIPPPSLHLPRLRAAPDAHIGRVIHDGYGLMPSYRRHLRGADRWAVVAYVRALQRSQDAALDELPPDLRARAVEVLP